MGRLCTVTNPSTDRKRDRGIIADSPRVATGAFKCSVDVELVAAVLKRNDNVPPLSAARIRRARSGGS